MPNVFSPGVAARHTVAPTNSSPLVIAIVNNPPTPNLASKHTHTHILKRKVTKVALKVHAVVQVCEYHVKRSLRLFKPNESNGLCR